MKPNAVLGYEYTKANSRPLSVSTNTDKNVLLFGSAGTGKSRDYVRNQLGQFHGNYVVTDLRNTMYDEYAEAYKEQGWDVKIVDFGSGPKVAYNPFLYVKNDATLHQFVNIVLGRHIHLAGNDITSDFSKYSEHALFCMVRLMQDTFPENAWNIDALSSIAIKDYHSFCKYMETYLSKKRDDITQQYYNNLLTLSEESWKSLMIKIAVELDELRMLDFDNATDLSEFRTKKSILFVELSTAYFSVLPSVFINQFCNLLCVDTNTEIPVHVILDESQLLYLPNLQELLRRTAETNTQFSIIMQAIQQLAKPYNDTWKDIVDSFDNILAYGCGDVTTTEVLYKLAEEWHPNPKIQCTFTKKKLFFFRRIVSSELPLQSRTFMKMPKADAILITKGEEKIKLIQKHR